MTASIVPFIERLFVGPVWPASVLVGVMLAYALVVAIGLFDFDFAGGAGSDIDGGGLQGEGMLDHAADGGAVSGIGAMTLRWLNLGKIPLVIWGSIFTSVFWAISYALWYGYDWQHYSPDFVPSVLLTIRNTVLATSITKLFTDRLGFLSRRGPTFEAGRLIGKTCEVSTSEVTPSFGQAEFKTDAAPLLLNIRTTSGTLPRGTTVEIIEFDSEKRVYKVAASTDTAV